MKNFQQTIITQYTNSTKMLGLLSDWNDDIDPQVNFKLFYTGIWNITTAAGYGLDVWGRIVGVSRNLKAGDNFQYLGFGEAFGYQSFGYGIFYSGQTPGATPLTLTDTVFRQLILLKAFANCTNASAYDINTILAALYKTEGTCYAEDLGGMRFILVFKFLLAPSDYSILTQSGVLLRPAGTSYSILEVP